MLPTEPPQILPASFPTPPPGGITISTGRPTNTTVNTGTDVIIYCPTNGIDTPSIEWFKDDTRVVSGGRITISTTRLPNTAITGILTIDDFQPSYAGTYNCQADNVAGTANSSIVLQPGVLCS